MTRSPLRTLFALTFMVGTPALILGCPKKPDPVAVEDAAPPPPPVVIDAAPTELVPLDQVDAGADTGAPDAAKKPGTGLTQSQTNVKACCNAMRAQAKAMGNTPESAQLTAAAAQCDAIALQVGPSKGPQAPEFELIRQLLKGKPTIPAVCTGL